jgi:2-hydroxy-3-keto-5-methylthiopentenyl-1-phosphate phosphatase
MGSQGMKPLVIFCDFDGTITMNDNIIAIMKHFNPDGWDLILNKAMNQNLSIQEAIGSMLGLLPASLKQEIIRFALDNMKIRPGFGEFITYCRDHQIQFLVTSGGIDFFVYPTLLPFGIPKENIYCNESDFSGENLVIVWPHPCDDQCDQHCGMCKATLIRSYSSEDYTRVMIGDSITDFAGAKLADIVFARSHLASECTKLQMPYHPYESFFEIMEQLNALRTSL